MTRRKWIQPLERANVKTLRLALRWILILATALILAPPGGPSPGAFEIGLILAFAASNIALTYLPDSLFASRQVEYLIVVADTFVEVKLPEDSGVAYKIDTSRNPLRGPKEAPVTIVEFSDFQCPYCAGLQSTLDQVLKAFPKEVNLVYKQFPLNIHQYARQAAVASMAAHQQGKFWQLHDRMFQNFSAINEENIKKWAKEVGLNMAEFEKVMQAGVVETAVQKDIADGAAARVLGTPTLFINGKRVQERSFEAFKKAILEELAAVKAPATTAPAKKAPTTAKPSGRQ